jgi:hypothetical protein
MRVEGSFTGLCIHSGKELRCDDAETDTRVDTASLRSLGIRSLVVTPIREDNRVVGVLMVFAPTPHAFTITHVAVLKTMADQISSLLLRERKTKEQGILPEPPRPPAPVAVAKPAPALPAPVVIKPATPRPAAFPLVPKVEPIKPAPLAEDVATAVARAKREGKRESNAEHRASLGTLESLVAETRRANNNLMVGIVTVVVIVAAGTFTYRNMMRTKPTPSVPPIQQQVPPETTPGPAVNDQQPTSELGAPTAPRPGTSRAASNALNPGAFIPAPAPVKTSPASPAFDRRSETRTGIPDTPRAKPSPTEEVVVPASGSSKIASNNGDLVDMTPAMNTPGASNTSGTLSSLTNPVAGPTPMMVTQSVLEPVQALKKVTAIYPAIARSRRLSGTVTVIATITVDGKATDLKFVGGPPVFRDAALSKTNRLKYISLRIKPWTHLRFAPSLT